MIFLIIKSIVPTYTYLYIHVVLFKNDFRQFGKPCDCERYTGATSGYQSGGLEVYGQFDID